MVRRRQVGSLECLALLTVRDLATVSSGNIARSAVSGGETVLTEAVRQEVRLQVSQLGSFLWGHVVFYLYDRVFEQVLEGILAAVEAKRQHLGTGTQDKTLEIWAMVQLSEILHMKSLRTLRIDLLPKMLRSSFVRNLDVFTKLRSLQFGTGTGDIALGVNKVGSLSACLHRGLARMTHLVDFSLKYNCSLDILARLATACGHSLRRLDVENSRQVDDDSLPHLRKFCSLVELNISKTLFSQEGQVSILRNLKHIRSLTRADFLCEAVESLSQEDPKLRLGVRDFWASEDYFFHTTQQMELVARVCPAIQEMVFLYQDRPTCQLEVLSAFSQLHKLELWGGDFYVDSFPLLLDQLGHRLTRLDLNHVDSLDQRALTLLSRQCHQLEFLGLSGCIMFHPDMAMPGDGPEQEMFRWQYGRREEELNQELHRFQNLQELSISSACPEPLLLTLLAMCPGIRTLVIGATCVVSDSLFQRVFSYHRFELLEVLDIREGRDLGMKTLSSLLLQSNNLRRVVGALSWGGMCRGDLEDLQDHMILCNMDIVFEDLA